jgi:phage-related protein
LVWIASSRHDMRAMPKDVRRSFGVALYAVQTGAVYVLHVFQKKSKRGKATPQRDIDLVEERLKRAREIQEAKAKEAQQ